MSELIDKHSYDAAVCMRSTFDAQQKLTVDIQKTTSETREGLEQIHNNFIKPHCSIVIPYGNDDVCGHKNAVQVVVGIAKNGDAVTAGGACRGQFCPLLINSNLE